MAIETEAPSPVPVVAGTATCGDCGTVIHLGYTDEDPLPSEVMIDCSGDEHRVDRGPPARSSSRSRASEGDGDGDSD